MKNITYLEKGEQACRSRNQRMNEKSITFRRKDSESVGFCRLSHRQYNVLVYFVLVFVLLFNGI